MLSSINRYRMFLALKKRNPTAFLVPCYDIDLAWHTHQLHHRIYREDTIGYLGKMFNHDDTVTDRRPDSKLTQADNITRELWKTHFGTHFATCGAMYRGDPPYSSLAPINGHRLATLTVYDNAVRTTTLTLMTGQFAKCTMPENVSQLWGPVPMPRLPPGTANDCDAATHRLAILFSYQQSHFEAFSLYGNVLFGKPEKIQKRVKITPFWYSQNQVTFHASSFSCHDNWHHIWHWQNKGGTEFLYIRIHRVDFTLMPSQTIYSKPRTFPKRTENIYVQKGLRTSFRELLVTLTIIYWRVNLYLYYYLWVFPTCINRSYYFTVWWIFFHNWRWVSASAIPDPLVCQQSRYSLTIKWLSSRILLEPTNFQHFNRWLLFSFMCMLG